MSCSCQNKSDCCDAVEEYASRLDAKVIALCTANDRYETVVEERDAALRRLNSALELAREVSATYGLADQWDPRDLQQIAFRILNENTGSAVEKRTHFESCPRCRSNDVVLYEPPLHPPPAVYYCRACSAEWRPTNEQRTAL